MRLAKSATPVVLVVMIAGHVVMIEVLAVMRTADRAQNARTRNHNKCKLKPAKLTVTKSRPETSHSLL